MSETVVSKVFLNINNKIYTIYTPHWIYNEFVHMSVCALITGSETLICSI